MSNGSLQGSKRPVLVSKRRMMEDTRPMQVYNARLLTNKIVRRERESGDERRIRVIPEAISPARFRMDFPRCIPKPAIHHHAMTRDAITELGKNRPICEGGENARKIAARPDRI